MSIHPYQRKILCYLLSALFMAMQLNSIAHGLEHLPSSPHAPQNQTAQAPVQDHDSHDHHHDLDHDASHHTTHHPPHSAPEYPAHTDAHEPAHHEHLRHTGYCDECAAVRVSALAVPQYWWLPQPVLHPPRFQRVQAYQPTLPTIVKHTLCRAPPARTHL